MVLRTPALAGGIYEKGGGIAAITLNRPENLNNLQRGYPKPSPVHNRTASEMNELGDISH